MSGSDATTGPAAARLRATEDALHKVQAQAAALEELSEQLSLSVHVLEAEVASLAQEVRASAEHAAARSADAVAGEHAEQAPRGPAAAEQIRSTDVDGARLVALNMALSGDPRDVTGRYIAEHFDVPDREQMLDEVYAAAE